MAAIVNTASEYMYQMATVAYHTLNGTQTIVLEEDVEYNGELLAAGTYEFPVDGRYWADFDREHPIEGAARGQAWTGVAHALIGELGVGTVTAQALTLGLALAGLFAGLGGAHSERVVGVWTGKCLHRPCEPCSTASIGEEEEERKEEEGRGSSHGRQAVAQPQIQYRQQRSQ